MSWTCEHCNTEFNIDPQPGQVVSCICQQADNKIVVPVPPRWVKWVARYRDPEDTGVGDTIERLLGVWGERFKALMARFDIDCGCSDRKDYFNLVYPYEQQE